MQLVSGNQPIPGPKTCGACNADVARHADRVKYTDGDYRCRPCHAARRQRELRQARLARIRGALARAAGAAVVLGTAVFVVWAYLGY